MNEVDKAKCPPDECKKPSSYELDQAKQRLENIKALFIAHFNECHHGIPSETCHDCGGYSSAIGMFKSVISQIEDQLNSNGKK